MAEVHTGATLRAPDHDDFAQWSDNRLVLAISQGSAEACSELYRRHIATVVAASRAVLRFGPDSEDVATEVFVRLWMTPEKFDPSRCSVVGFLRMSAKRRSIDYLRSSSARARREKTDFQDDVSTPHNSDAELIASEEIEVVKRYIANLPALERESIELAFYGDISYRAVAAHLGLAEGTVKSRIRSGLKRLQKIEDLRNVHQQFDSSANSAVAAMETDLENERE